MIHRAMDKLRLATILVFVIGCIAGCSSSAYTPAMPTAMMAGSTPMMIATQTVASQPISAKAVVACLDLTTSYPREYFERAKNGLADQIEAMLAPGRGETVVYVLGIGHKSYQIELMTIRVPAIPAPPTPPLPQPTPTALSGNNPFDKKGNAEREAQNQEARNQVMAAGNAAQANYDNALKQIDQLLVEGREAVKRQTAELRALSPQADNVGSEMCGAFLKGGELLADAKASEKYLVIASDMESYGPQVASCELDLRGVKVRVVCFFCQDTETCPGRKTDWKQRFLRAEASPDVRFLDPIQGFEGVFE